MHVKRILGKVMLAAMAPIIFLVLAEGLLRNASIGYPTSFLLKSEINGQTILSANPFFGYRFFDPRMARNPAPIQIVMPKPDGVTRIAVLGESAAMGDPLIEFNLARGLEKMLNKPGDPRRFEVINAAMTAINSHVITEIARDLAREADIDLFLLYIGNNEVVGPYGPGTILTEVGWDARFNRLRVVSSRLRLAGLLRAMTAALGSKNGGPAWRGMEMFEKQRIAWDDPRLATMAQQYADNLTRIIGLARANGADVLLGTMAVNLSAFAPLSSTNRSDLSPVQLRDWNRLYREGGTAWQAGEITGAEEAFRAALALDDQHAEIHFRLAETLVATGHADEAAPHFQRARDLDTQRFRTDRSLNRLIHDVAARHDHVTLIDIETAFGTRNHDRLFVDHVHFSMEGLHLACQTIYDALALRYDLPPPIDHTELMARLHRTPWVDRREASLMLQRRNRPPFTYQYGNRAHLEHLVARIDKLTQQLEGRVIDETRPQRDAQQQAYPDDFLYAWPWAHQLALEGRWAEIVSELDPIAKKLGGYTDLHNLNAMASAMAGQPEQAAALLLRSGPPYGYYLAEAARGIRDLLRAENRPAEAETFIKTLRAAARFPGENEL